MFQYVVFPDCPSNESCSVRNASDNNPFLQHYHSNMVENDQQDTFLQTLLSSLLQSQTALQDSSKQKDHYFSSVQRQNTQTQPMNLYQQQNLSQPSQPRVQLNPQPRFELKPQPRVQLNTQPQPRVQLNTQPQSRFELKPQTLPGFVFNPQPQPRFGLNSQSQQRVQPKAQPEPLSKSQYQEQYQILYNKYNQKSVLQEEQYRQQVKKENERHNATLQQLKDQYSKTYGIERSHFLESVKLIQQSCQLGNQQSCRPEYTWNQLKDLLHDIDLQTIKNPGTKDSINKISSIEEYNEDESESEYTWTEEEYMDEDSYDSSYDSSYESEDSYNEEFNDYYEYVDLSKILS